MFNFQTVSQHCSAVINRRRSSDHDKKIILDTSYIELLIYSLFKIDLLNFIKVKAILAKEFHIQPSEVDNMFAWEYELFMKELNEIVKAENDKQQKEMDKAGIKDAKKMSDPRNIRKMQDAAMPKMPSAPVPNMNMGSMKMPKF